MKIVVVGAGAMGSLYGGWLAKLSENSVLLVDSWQDHVERLQTRGLTIETAGGAEQIRIQAVLPEKAEMIADLLIVFTKSHQTKAALEQVKQVICPDTLVLSLQNGLGNVEKLTAYLPIKQVIVGTTTFPCDILGPGTIKTEGHGTTKIMSADGINRSQTGVVAELLNRAGFNCSVEKDVFQIIWEKLAFNCALNALCAVTRLPVGGIGRVTEGRQLALQVAKEVIAVANHKGIPASYERCQHAIEQAFELHEHHQPSMLQDILARRATEISALNGAVAEEAQRYGLDVPITALLAKLVAVIEKNVTLSTVENA